MKNLVNTQIVQDFVEILNRIFHFDVYSINS